MGPWVRRRRDGYAVLDKGDLRRILLACGILAAFAVGEMGVFWLTMNKPTERFLRAWAKVEEAGFHGRFLETEQNRGGPLGEKKERYYLQAWLGWNSTDSLAGKKTQRLESIQEPWDCSDTLPALRSVASGAEGNLGICQ